MASKLRSGLVVACACALAGCQDLPDVPGGECGNGVLEVGEDCEPTAGGTCGAADGANACHYECSADVACPDGYGCGTDGRCRQAAGVFESGATLTLVVDDIAVGDVDGDGFEDVIAVSGTSVQIRYGSAQADLASALDGQVSSPETAIAVDDLDWDGASDLLIATGPGIEAFLGSAERTLDPFSYPVAAFGPGANTVHGAPADVDPELTVDDVVVAWEAQLGFPTSELASAVAALPDPPGNGTPNAAALAAPLPTARLASTRLDPTIVDPSVEVLVGYFGTPELHVYRATADPLTIAADPTAIALGAALSPGSAMVLGWFDGDHCLDLVVHTVDGRLLVLRGTPLATLCDDALRAPVVLGALADGERLLAAADLDADGVTDLVTSAAIHRLDGAVPAAATTLTTFGGAFEAVQVVDINGDAMPDVAGFREGLPDVEVLINAGAAFNRFVVATSDPIQRLAAGDFDGDLTPDLAIVERDSTGDEPIYTVSVSFGAFHGPPGARVAMDRFDGVSGVTAANVIGSSAEPDAVADLIVFEHVVERDQIDVTILGGSGARAMTSPLILRNGGLEEPEALVVGQLTGEAALDVFAIGSAGTAFLFAGDGDGGFVEPELAAWPGDFAYGDAVWAAGDLDGDGVEEIAAAEGSGRTRVVVFTPDVQGLDAIAALEDLDGFAGAHSIALADLDGPDEGADAGDADLLVAVDGVVGSPGGLYAGWNAGGEIGALVAIPGADGCIDAAVLQLDSDPAPELVAFCAEGARFALRRFDAVGPETLEAAVDPLGVLAGASRRTRLLAADVDGDGLDDLVVATQGGVTADVRILVQSDLHDLLD